MTDKNKIMDMLDEEIRSCFPAIEYAREHCGAIIEAAYQNCVRKVYTTRGSDLGVACPSLVNHRVIGGHKKGRVIKSIPEKDAYCEIGYDSDNKPLYFKSVNEYRSEDTYFFFAYDNAVWAMEMENVFKNEVSRSVRTHRIKKCVYDKQGRIRFYAEMETYGFALANLYEYPEDAGKPIICHFYYYVTHLESEPDPANPRWENTQFYEHLYEISPDLKVITEYNCNADGAYVFSRQITSGGKKSAKPKAAADSYPKFAAWLDAELEKDTPENGGIYFDLFSPTEDGFGIYFSIAETFDPDDDDWACEPAYWSDNMHMVSTNGEMEWEAALGTSVKLIRKYLREGKYKSILRQYDGIGTAFSDSEIEYVYVRK
ncbi:MAG: hypothetical protein K5695_17235 [Oscillospiraceae bacterium]|nr:hypothetical protein [Oscillospiraceae bacterium]